MMKSLWDDNEARQYQDNPLALRVYTSRLLGREPDLVMHGGGNTSVKATQTNLFKETEEILYIKGSGWDLATIEAAGFAPVRLDVLKRMAQLPQLSDTQMVNLQRCAMTDPNAPNPSVEAILHAMIPFKFVDHTHADAVITVTNTKKGEERIRQIYGDRILIVPYVMPGFILAQKIYAMTRNIDWAKLEGIILMNHGVFSFADDGRVSYERMIRIVSQAEEYLAKHAAVRTSPKTEVAVNLQELARLRRCVSQVKGGAIVVRLEAGAEQLNFANHPHVASIATRGPLTPDHVIRTKRIPVIIGKNPDNDVTHFAKEYQKYFKRHANGNLTCLDPAPRWGIWPGRGILAFGSNIKEVQMITDIVNHTVKAIQNAEALGGWNALPEKEIFDIEYWELEQAKLKKGGKTPIYQGKVALVTGAASGIGRACVETLHEHGAVVVGLDINPQMPKLFRKDGILGIICDVTDKDSVRKVVETTVRQFGGLDILISNAGIFPTGEYIADMQSETWTKSIHVNLSSHQYLLKICIPYLSLGIDPAVVIMASKNVPAPGPGAGAYSVAKAGLTQLARIAALELAPLGIRVNVIHPNQVFDTGIWTPEVLANRARQYGMEVEEYKTSNLLNVQISSRDVAELVCAMVGPVFSKTTGAQVPIDGGNERVI